MENVSEDSMALEMKEWIISNLEKNVSLNFPCQKFESFVLESCNAIFEGIIPINLVLYKENKAHFEENTIAAVRAKQWHGPKHGVVCMDPDIDFEVVVYKG